MKQLFSLKIKIKLFFLTKTASHGPSRSWWDCHLTVKKSWAG